MKIISYIAPAKAILSGEHAVVYGKPGLVSAINLTMQFAVWNDVNKNIDKAIEHIDNTVQNYLKKESINYHKKQFNFSILSNIPIGQNLGSSAALCVSASAALLEFYTDRQFNKDAVNSVAYQAEKYFHKNASGVDVSTSCHGGLIYYRKEFEFLKTISALHQKLPKKFEDNLFLINSGKAMETTGDMVDRMGKLYNAKPEKTEKILNEIEKITKRMVVSVIKEDDVYFKKNISDNEILLEKLGVVSTRAIKLLKQLSSYGAGKMTGAGGIKQGSGFLIFYADKPQELIDFLNKQKITFYKFRQNQTGLQRL